MAPSYKIQTKFKIIRSFKDISRTGSVRVLLVVNSFMFVLVVSRRHVIIMIRATANKEC